MKVELGKKLDKLVEWGVLRRPEELGITVEYCSPSMIIPKAEKDEYRLVTDFSYLNKFILKFPGSSPTIQEAKEAIARAQYVGLLDLSNYFYQGGVSREDASYLGVTHPFKGILVYVTEPQGLKNSSEHAYERLRRIFGDMIMEGELTTMADGLYVLADTEEDFVERFREVMRRAKLCGLTVKPSKLELAPKKTILFGWKVENNEWTPTAHTISALANSQRPKTARQLRGWLGAFKQFSQCVNDYAPLLSGLEKMHSSLGSRDYLTWTDENIKMFEEAKKATSRVESLTTPRPSDRLHTYSDYSQEAEAVGGRMILKRTLDNGEETTKLVGYFSAKLDKSKVRWSPCEGESLGCRLVIEHFSSYIRQSNHTTIHHTDNRPTVQAWARFRKGAYSSSSRISAFLTGLSALPIEIQYTPGKLMHSSDFASRNPRNCEEKKCQVCTFVKEWTELGDRCGKLHMVKVEDILSGQATVPYHQRKTWKEMQDNDMVHTKLRNMIATGQLPEKKKTNGPYTKLKYLRRRLVSEKH